MKKTIFLVLIGLFGLCLTAQDKVAKIEFKQQTIDYGTIQKGSDGVRSFAFTNTGDAPLIISNVKSSCGCTIPKKPDAPVLPGKSSEIQVKYDTNRVGPIRKAITVTSNATEPTTILKIKGEILAPEPKK